MKANYFKGLVKAELVGQEVGRNVVPNYDALSFLSEYTFDNVKGMEDDVKGQLRQVLQRGIVDGKSYSEVAKDIKKVFDKGEVRLKAIARTEEHRALVQGELQGMKSLGLKGTKEWKATMDSRTCPICKRLNVKVVGLDEVFKDKEGEWSAAPVHPNCRCVLKYEVE